MSRLALFLLGPPRIERDGVPIKTDRSKVIALAVYLAITGESHTRDALATLFWPESNQAKARTALRRALWILKQSIGKEWSEIKRESLALKRGDGFYLDVDHFHSLLAACRTHGHASHKVCPACIEPLTEAVALYRDDFLTGFCLRDTPHFDEWQFFQGERLRCEASGALERLTRWHSTQGEFEPVITYARRWLALDPLHEPAHRLLIQLYAQVGQRAAALRQYWECERILEQELGLPPQQETTQLYQIIRKSRKPSPLGLTPAPLVTRSHHLPPPATSFIGREKELVEIDRLLDDSACRLLTLVGPGGIGKTRLALQAALQATTEENHAFPHGIHFVSLVTLSSAGLLVPTIADALELSLQGVIDPKVRLLDYLHEKKVLLVLDNLEHLLSSSISPACWGDRERAGLLVEILERAPGVKLLVTSRERLNLRWEWILEIQGLTFPEDDEMEDYAVADYDAVRLFLQSARRVQPAFSLSEKLAVARICRFLKGLPLGIELAAAWTQMFPCREIAQKIERDPGFLVTFLHDMPERHRSLWAVFDHSWSLLSEQERVVCSRLSVFQGEFRGETAERVAGASLPVLLALMHKSFLRRNATGRYEMLEVLRQYAAEKLEEYPQEWHEAHDRHREYYADCFTLDEATASGNGSGKRFYR